MILNIGVIKEVRKSHQPKKDLILKVIKKCLVKRYNFVNMEIIFVSLNKSQQLNFQFRQKNSPTNVISIEYQEDRDAFNILNGELYLCDEIVVQESLQQNKTILSHYIHLLIHGILHIQGFDHIKDEDAVVMEQKEIMIMQQLGYNNPYLE